MFKTAILIIGMHCADGRPCETIETESFNTQQVSSISISSKPDKLDKE